MLDCGVGAVLVDGRNAKLDDKYTMPSKDAGGGVWRGAGGGVSAVCLPAGDGGGAGGVYRNDTDGVTIEVEGPKARVEAFVERLRAEAPPLARIDSIVVRELVVVGETGFRIVASEVLGRVSTGIPADAATCADCCANWRIQRIGDIAIHF